MPVLGTKGGELDLLLKQGSTFGPHQITLKDSNNQPINITGATIRAQIRKTSDAANPVATGDFVLVTPGSGVFTFGFSSVSTSSLLVDTVSETGTDSQYVWDMEIQYSDGRVYPLMYGKVSVFREVTK
jgi:hypothetical protein